MPPKIQPPITDFFRQQLERPLPFTSPDPRRDGDAVMPETPSQRRSQSPGVIVSGTPPTPFSPFSLEAQSVPRSASPSASPRFVPDHTDHEVAHANRGLIGAQIPPRSPGPMLSPSSGTTAENFAAQQAYQQFANAQQERQQQKQQQEQEDPAAAARQRAARQAQIDNPDVLTQFQGGKTRSKMVKKSKKTRRSKKSNKRRNRRSKSRSRSRSKKSYFY